MGAILNKQPLVSVVVTTRNEEKHIESCLKSIRLQTYPNIEIIVVDNNSIDKTKDIAIKIVGRTNVFNISEHINLAKIMNYRGAQVNFGVSKAKGSIIFFPDADMTFDCGLIEEAVYMIKSGYDALHVPEIIIGKGFFGKIRNFERSFYNETCIDAVRIVTCYAFQHIGGFDEINIPFAPDDWDLTKSLKKEHFRFSITKSKKYHHEELLNIKTYLTKKADYNWTFETYIKKWGKHDFDIKKQFGIYYRYFGVFIEGMKWRKIICHPILTSGMYSLRLIVGTTYILHKLKSLHMKRNQ